MWDRRQFLNSSLRASLGALLIDTALFSSAHAASDTSEPKASSINRYLELTKTAAECIRTGEACEAHCQEQLAQTGGSGFAKCNSRVHEMVAMTQALLTLASANSPLTPKLAAICAEACRACAEACNEHKEHFAHGMHLACKVCMEACINCEKACRKLTAAV